jgi:hypothetical protein
MQDIDYCKSARVTIENSKVVSEPNASQFLKYEQLVIPQLTRISATRMLLITCESHISKNVFPELVLCESRDAIGYSDKEGFIRYIRSEGIIACPHPLEGVIRAVCIPIYRSVRRLKQQVNALPLR